MQHLCVSHTREKNSMHILELTIKLSILFVFVSVFILFNSVDAVSDTQLVCSTSHSNQIAEVPVTVQFGTAERTVDNILFHYLQDPVITDATPTESFCG